MAPCGARGNVRGAPARLPLRRVDGARPSGDAVTPVCEHARPTIPVATACRQPVPLRQRRGCDPRTVAEYRPRVVRADSRFWSHRWSTQKEVHFVRVSHPISTRRPFGPDHSALRPNAPQDHEKPHMNAIRLLATGPASAQSLTREDLPDPVPGAGQVLIDVAACGVCRTDLHITEGEVSARLPSPSATRPPAASPPSAPASPLTPSVMPSA